VSGAHELFIYWRCRLADRDIALAAARALQVRLVAGAQGLSAGLYVREDEANAGTGTATVMETYAAPGGIAAPLRERITDDGNRCLGPWLQGARHVETFRRA
jgi:hypothetical protein